MRVHAHVTVRMWRSEDSRQESVLFFHHSVPDLALRSSGLAAGTFQSLKQPVQVLVSLRRRIPPKRMWEKAATLSSSSNKSLNLQTGSSSDLPNYTRTCVEFQDVMVQPSIQQMIQQWTLGFQPGFKHTRFLSPNCRTQVYTEPKCHKLAA